jgi:hypothetical protein
MEADLEVDHGVAPRSRRVCGVPGGAPLVAVLAARGPHWQLGACAVGPPTHVVRQHEDPGAPGGVLRSYRGH